MTFFVGRIRYRDQNKIIDVRYRVWSLLKSLVASELFFPLRKVVWVLSWHTPCAGCSTFLHRVINSKLPWLRAASTSSLTTYSVERQRNLCWWKHTVNWSSAVFSVVWSESCEIKAVRVKGGKSLRNGMWNGVRNGIIMRNTIYAGNKLTEERILFSRHFYKSSSVFDVADY